MNGAAVVCHRRGTTRHRHDGFSLLELMIGIAILGLGMVMVATIFPVAWSRARTLSEYTAEKSATAGAYTTVKSLVHVSGSSRNSSSFHGDLLWDFLNDRSIRACRNYWADDSEFYADVLPHDTLVHALNMENIRVEERRFISEDTWMIQDPDGVLYREGDVNVGDSAGQDVVEESFFRSRIRFHQRVYPPIERREDVDRTGTFQQGEDGDRWDDALATRRFCWSVLHRFTRKPAYKDETRSFQLFIVTLRRPNPNYRYARQDREGGIPNPCDLTIGAVVPEALPPDQDVMFPVPWRVQVEFPDIKIDDEPTGVPTEILVPPRGASNDEDVNRMLSGMFPTGAYFIDEVTGKYYKVTKRRVTGAMGEQAHLTLDQEVVVKDLDLDNDDPRCSEPFCVVDRLDDAERLRTVWVFPPAVEATRGPKDTLVFQGNQPVVGISEPVLKVPPVKGD